MFCPNCGKELSESAAFCPECGNALRAAAPAATDATQTTAGTVQTAPAPAKKKKKKGPIVAIVLLIVIAAAGTTGSVLWNNDNFRCWLDVREAGKMYDADDYESAVEAYQRALDRVEDSSEAIDGLMRVAKSYYIQENYKEALAIYDLILKQDPENQKALSGQRDCYLTQGETALKNARYEKALDYYKKARKINETLDSDEGNGAIRDGQLQAYMGLAQESDEKSDYLKAREYYDAVLAEADHDSTLYAQAKDGHAQTSLMLAMQNHAVGDYRTAETYYREILDVESVGRLAYLGLTDLYVEWGDVESAVTLLEEGTSYYADASLQQRLKTLRESLKPVSPYPILTDAKGNKYDLGGAEVYIYTWFGEGRTEGPYQDALDEYREWAQKEYNFTMIWDQSGSWGMQNDFADLAYGWQDTEGKLRFYMLPGDQATVLTAIHDNLMWNLSSLGVFDFDENRWKVNGVSDLYRMNGDVYACAAGAPEPRIGMFFNATLLEQLTGITADDMYDLQAKGEWTWDKFEEICERIYQAGDINSDGVQDIYAIAGGTAYLYNAFMHSNNAMLFELGPDGKFIYRAADPATVAALEFSRKIETAHYWLNPQDYEAWNYFSDAFDKQGTIVFTPDQAYLINSGNAYNQNDDTNTGEYGFLMFPKGPDAPKDYYINSYTDNIMAIPKCYSEDEARIIAAAYNIWTADVIPGYIGYNSRLDGYESGVYHERALNETLARMMSEGAFIDTSALLPGADTYVWANTSKSISQIISENESAWRKAIDDFNYR